MICMGLLVLFQFVQNFIRSSRQAGLYAFLKLTKMTTCFLLTNVTSHSTDFRRRICSTRDHGFQNPPWYSTYCELNRGSVLFSKALERSCKWLVSKRFPYSCWSYSSCFLVRRIKLSYIWPDSVSVSQIFWKVYYVNPFFHPVSIV